MTVIDGGAMILLHLDAGMGRFVVRALSDAEEEMQLTDAGVRQIVSHAWLGLRKSATLIHTRTFSEISESGRL